MNAHLTEISHPVGPGAHAVLILGGAGWQVVADLVVLDNITLLTLPSHAPELNLVKTVWQFLRDNWIGERIFDFYEDILDQCCETSNKLVAQASIVMPRTARMGLSVTSYAGWYELANIVTNSYVIDYGTE